MNTWNQEQLNQLPKEMLVQLYLQMDSALDTIMEQNRKITEQNERQAHQIEALQENLAVLVQNRFGRKTEKVKQTDGQYSLDFDTMTLVLNEAEQLTENGPAAEPEAETVIVRHSPHRSKGKMERDLQSVPTMDQDCTLSEEVLTALFPDGYTELPAEKMRPLLEYTPAHMQQVINHVHVYKGKDGTIVKAERPQRLFKGSIATPSLISAVMNSKYINAVPLNRCAQEFAGNGAVLSREVLATWMIRVSERYFSLLYDRMHQKLLESRLVHCDETPFVVVQNGKFSGTKDYMWVYHTSPEHGSPPVYLYQYSPTRKTENPRNFLKGYCGILVTDGYQVYHALEKECGGDLKVAGCWAHAKRKYAELRKSLKPDNPHRVLCVKGEKYISAIYHVDNLYKDMDPEERKKNRQDHVKPLVEAYFAWVKEQMPKTDPSSDTGRALNYSLNQEPYLRTFLENGEVPLDNNDAERSIKKFCVGKKNWQISATKNGAEASGILYSIAETARANGLRPYYYFKHVLETMIPHMDDKTTDFLEELMPWSESLPEVCRSKEK